MTWDTMIYIYLWLAGMAGGAYFCGFLVDRFTGRTSRTLLQLAVYIGIPLAVVGVILLVADLGRPIRFWHLFTQFKWVSPMSLGTWILLVWVGIAVTMVVFWQVERFLGKERARGLRQLRGFLSWIGVVFAVLLMVYTGVLLANSAQPLWAGTALLPSLFVASAISTGVAALVIAAIVVNAITGAHLVKLRLAMNQILGSTDWTIPDRTVARLAEAHVMVVLVEMAALIAYAVWLATSPVSGASEALRLLTTGVLAPAFWAGVVFLALLLPLALELFNWGKEIGARIVLRRIMASSACVILGGLVLRAVIVIGGQI